MKLLFCLLPAFLTITSCHGLILPPGLTLPGQTKTALKLSSESMTSRRHSPLHDDSAEEMKKDIACMREEALRRIEILNAQMHDAEDAWNHQKAEEAKLISENDDSKYSSSDSTQETPKTSKSLDHVEDASSFKESAAASKSLDHVEDASSFKESAAADALYKGRLEREGSPLYFMDSVVSDDQTTVSKQSHTVPSGLQVTGTKSPLRMLDDTRWRLMLNVGRERGTWMPKEWAASGDRLRLQLELDFSSEQLYEREEFLNGFGGARVLKVIHNEGQVAPSMQEGGRKVRITQGGWRVAPGEGPMGTSVLRFYFDLEQEAKHSGSDVYCPAGRIYCTCGYFSMADRYKHDKPSEKEILKQEMSDLEAQYTALSMENENDPDLVSWTKFQRSRKMMDIRSQASKLNSRMHEAQVREPDKSLLRLSQDQSVGLTREGGICCKINKGLAIEYHILGKFEIGSLACRDHSDYRDLLP